MLSVCHSHSFKVVLGKSTFAKHFHTSRPTLQGFTNRQAPGLVNFVPALAYHFCLNLLAAFTQPGARLLVEPCTMILGYCSTFQEWINCHRKQFPYYVVGFLNDNISLGIENTLLLSTAKELLHLRPEVARASSPFTFLRA